MTPQVLSPSHERGYYIIWDTAEWCKNRVCCRRVTRSSLVEFLGVQMLTVEQQREFTLHYGDLDTTLGQAPVAS